MLFLRNRYLDLCIEMERRNYKFDLDRASCFDGLDEQFMNDWKECLEDNEIVMKRINQRMKEKPHLY